MTAAVRTDQYLTLFRAALGQSARDSEALLREVFHAALRSLDEAIAHPCGRLERDQLRMSHKFLDDKAAAMCAQFPVLLRQIFQNKQAGSSQFEELALGELSHDQLLHMDEIQVRERVEMARVLRLVQLTVQSSLNELNRYMSALLGFDHIKPEHNPLRPQIYLKVLQDAMVDAAVPPQIRITWVNHMSTALGKALRGSYALLAQKIKSYGVIPLSMDKTVEPNKRVMGAQTELVTRQQSDADESSNQPNMLTLDRLHELLAGQPMTDQNVAPDETETQFSGAFDLNAFGMNDISQENTDKATTDFAATVPAAFEALQNMNQVDDVITSLSQRQRPTSSMASKPESVRQKFRSRCQNSAQSLSLEVMFHMVDNLEQDARLLEPIRRVIEKLEPALFRLVKVDVRFFNDKLHPARRLLQEITQRGLAFDSADAPGFALFIRSLHRYVNPLSRMPIDSAEPFDLALRNLNSMWSEQSVASSQTVQQAVQVLGQAEERNLLAEKMVAAMEQIPDMQRVPAAVAEFLCGPWAQVMAYAELNNTEGVEDPGGYKNLVNILLWSAQPELTRQDVAKLTKRVSRLLSKLREGLALIDYPALKTSSFFDLLMKLHQQAFRPMPGESEQQTINPRENLLRNHHHWVAPAEAQASGFMDMFEEEAAQSPAQRTDLSSRPMLDSVIPMSSQDNPAQSTVDLEQLVVGAWVEIGVKGVWQRSQLSWISPKNSMYLFTNVYGGTQSMTRRSLEKLMVTKVFRVVSEQSMVDGALDAVVHTAMLNSLDIRP